MHLPRLVPQLPHGQPGQLPHAVHGDLPLTGGVARPLAGGTTHDGVHHAHCGNLSPLVGITKARLALPTRPGLLFTVSGPPGSILLYSLPTLWGFCLYHSRLQCIIIFYSLGLSNSTFKNLL
eukprot:TRINITY_DN75724_c0_g1_i1.p1 TRINITY_DN75724_c0_g1~~TRINITY_DN75724_c0_g1_i1.p1  ORF type:complete len:122 (+),score=8.08 TRINITY_DN75724_c0_g1_i1:161-526(+)